jgi:hypothetical protein
MLTENMIRLPIAKLQVLGGKLSGKIFISYRREDEPAEARSIRDRLAGIFGTDTIFMDVANLGAGAHFEEELNAALTDCAAFIAIIGPKWLDLLKTRRQDGVQDYVLMEISNALGRDILVVPTLVRGAKLPSHSDLPDEISDLVLRQAHVISHEKFSSDVADLANALQQKTELKPAAKTAQWRRLRLMGGIAVLFIVVGLLIIFYGRSPKAGAEILVFTHDQGLTREVGEQIKSELTSSEVNIRVHRHSDRRRADAIYIAEDAPVELVRRVIPHVMGEIAYIFPLDYSIKSSVEMRRATIAVGLMSDFEYYHGNSAEKPYPVNASQLLWLSEKGLDQAAFVERLRYLAPARKRSD